MTRRQYVARKRIYQSKLQKAQRRASFVVRRAAARGLVVDATQKGLVPCQSGHLQVVREVRKFAGVYLYRSSACTGCLAGRKYVGDREEGATVEQPDDILGCILIQNHWLISLTPIEVGQVVEAKNPTDITEESIVV